MSYLSFKFISGFYVIGVKFCSVLGYSFRSGFCIRFSNSNRTDVRDSNLPGLTDSG